MTLICPSGQAGWHKACPNRPLIYYLVSHQMPIFLKNSSLFS